MATIGSLVVNLIANTTQFSGGMQKGVQDVKKFEAAAKTTSATVASLGTMAIGAGAGFLAFQAANKAAAWIRDSAAAAAEAERVFAQLDAVIKSTNNEAGVGAEKVKAFANSLSTTTEFSRNQVVAAESLLLTFTNIKDTFGEAITTVTDMSAALGQDLKASVIQVGKALNDPIKGISALQEIGVSFNDQQKDMVKRLMDTGKAAEAQRIILAELKKEYGGSAEAQGKTGQGRWGILGNTLRDLRGEFMQFLGDYSGVNSAVGWINDRVADENDPRKRLLSEGAYYGGMTAQEIRDLSGDTEPLPPPKAAPKGPTWGEQARSQLAKRLEGIDHSNFKTAKEIQEAYNRAAGNWKNASKEASEYFFLSLKASEDVLKVTETRLAAEKRQAEEKKRMEKFGGQLDFLLGSQHIGKNRSKLWDKVAFDKQFAAPGTVPGSEVNEDISETAKRQLRVQEKIAANTAKRPVAALERGSPEAYSATIAKLLPTPVVIGGA